MGKLVNYWAESKVATVGCLELEDLSVSFTLNEGLFKMRNIQVVDDISLKIEAGEIVALVGASGAGKSLLALAILGLLPENANTTGLIRYNGEVLDARRTAILRGKEIALIPQSISALDPLMPVGRQLLSGEKKDLESKLNDLLAQMNMPTSVGKMYPHQLSGGMARKVLLAMALADPVPVIIADEPTPGLHRDDIEVMVQLFKRASAQGSAVLLITHDLEVACRVADRIAVMHGGTLVEVAPVSDYTGQGERLRHPYSKALWRALPHNGFSPGSSSPLLQDVAWPEKGKGCRYFSLCPLGTGDCQKVRPPWQSIRGGMVRCGHAT